MDQHADSRQALRQYLLGSLPQEDLPGLEERLLTDEGAFEGLLVEEEELIDDYVAGDLSADERSRFERHFLSTEERRRQLNFALALDRYTSAKKVDEPEAEKVDGRVSAREPEPPARPTLFERLGAFWGGRAWGARAALAFGAAAVVVAALYLPGLFAPRTFATLTLSAAAGDRAVGVRAEKVTLPLRADALRIRLTLPAGTPPAARHRVELLSQGGRPEAVEAEGRDGDSVSVVIPASRLARGQYALRLFAFAADGAERRVEGNYYFDVE